MRLGGVTTAMTLAVLERWGSLSLHPAPGVPVFPESQQPPSLWPPPCEDLAERCECPTETATAPSSNLQRPQSFVLGAIELWGIVAAVWQIGWWSLRMLGYQAKPALITQDFQSQTLPTGEPELIAELQTRLQQEQAAKKEVESELLREKTAKQEALAEIRELESQLASTREKLHQTAEELRVQKKERELQVLQLGHLFDERMAEHKQLRESQDQVQEFRDRVRDLEQALSQKEKDLQAVRRDLERKTELEQEQQQKMNILGVKIAATVATHMASPMPTPRYRSALLSGRQTPRVSCSEPPMVLLPPALPLSSSGSTPQATPEESRRTKPWSASLSPTPTGSLLLPKLVQEPSQEPISSPMGLVRTRARELEAKASHHPPLPKLNLAAINRAAPAEKGPQQLEPMKVAVPKLALGGIVQNLSECVSPSRVGAANEGDSHRAPRLSAGSCSSATISPIGTGRLLGSHRDCASPSSPDANSQMREKLIQARLKTEGDPSVPLLGADVNFSSASPPRAGRHWERQSSEASSTGSARRAKGPGIEDGRRSPPAEADAAGSGRLPSGGRQISAGDLMPPPPPSRQTSGSVVGTNQAEVFWGEDRASDPTTPPTAARNYAANHYMIGTVSEGSSSDSDLDDYPSDEEPDQAAGVAITAQHRTPESTLKRPLVPELPLGSLPGLPPSLRA